MGKGIPLFCIYACTFVVGYSLTGILSQIFGPEKMNLCGELSILFGVCATCLCLLIKYKCVSQKQTHLSQVLMAVFVAVHLFVMGINGWITIDKWHGHLPPISLISFVFALLACLFFLWPIRKSSLKTEVNP